MLQESVLTCRFAQRVASIKTKIILNESFDPVEEMNSLRNENDDLKHRINILMKNQRRVCNRLEILNFKIEKKGKF